MTSSGKLIGASAPFGVDVLSSYRMADERYIGRVIYLTFTTPVDLGRWLPAPLRPVDPHSAFLKLYHLTRNPVGEPARDIGYNAYHEVCVTVAATIPGDPAERHFNLGMWLDRDWAVYKAREVLGWPKKMADIDIVWPIVPDPGGRHAPVGTRKTFGARISRYGQSIIEVEGTLSDDIAPSRIPPFDGFYSVRHLVAPDGDPRHRIRQLLRIEPHSGWASEPMFAEAKLSFGSCGDERLDAFGEVTVTGCSIRETGWVLPAYPATVLDEDLDFEPEVG
ncbi:acetoacetate decarboxylase family protein [Acuticoccus sediminis]|uniref:acetoacetate decarboxylase family protein n=1 Tax=Acuticoccus sediminis TaxID=2184697 RepID=UPI001CFC6B51|nr:acetoacetate decarboxylase family protein [Acuticoccus sediminis]